MLVLKCPNCSRELTIPEDLLGKPVSDMLGEPGIGAEVLLRELLSTGNPVYDREVSSELSGKPGEVRHWLVNYFPIREGGSLTQVGVIAVDVTARRNAENSNSSSSQATCWSPCR